MVALVGIAAVTFWWEPVMALVAGLVYAGLGVLFDPSTSGRYAEAVVGMAALGGITVLRALRARQAQVADHVSELEVLTVAPTPLAPRARLHGGRAAYPIVGIAGLLLAAGSLAGYHAATSAEQAHLDRAQPSQARVVSGVDGDYRQAFELENGPRAGTRLLIAVTDELPSGTERDVLLDPADASWARLTSEPQGYTFWFGWVMVGAFAAAWAGLGLVGAARSTAMHATPRQHRVRVNSDGRAQLILARSSQPVAVAPIAPGDLRSGIGHLPWGGAIVPALVRGPLADGRWVSIETRIGPLTVTGPIRATPRWRPLWTATSILPVTRTNPGRGRPGARLNKHAERLVGIWRTVGQVALVGGGCLFLWLGLQQAGPAWDAAHGRGVPGSIEITSEDCGGRGPCQHYGTFRSSDGQYSFTDVEVVGGSADVGTSIPALYEGHGETPDTVFAPGWKGFAESGLFFFGALAFIVQPAGRVLAALSRRRRPPSGRHASGLS